MSGTEQTAQALGGPGGQLGGQTSPQQMQAKFQSVVAGVQEVFRVFNAIPGADKAKIQQAAQLMQQATQLLASAVPKGGAGQAPGASPGASSAQPPVPPG
jgi:hypothetical protein